MDDPNYYDLEVIIINIVIVSAIVFVVYHHFINIVIINIQFVNTIKYSMSIIITTVLIAKKTVKKKQRFLYLEKKSTMQMIL